MNPIHPGNTIVTAGDGNYAWGAWLLVASMRKNDMKEPVLIGVQKWPDAWLADILKFPGVELHELPADARRNVNCNKPRVMLAARSEIVTWVDCDGIFSGNASASLIGEERALYLRPRTPGECRELYRRERPAGDSGDTVPESVLKIWKRDVAEREEPSRQYSCSSVVISCHRRNRPFIERWMQQIDQVFPPDVKANRRRAGYHQADDSVLNSLLFFANDAPPVTADYRADRLEEPHYLHYAFNPKPWQMWNPYTLNFFDATLEVVEWAVEAGYAPRAELPFPLRRNNRMACSLMAPLAENVVRWKKLQKKLRGK